MLVSAAIRPDSVPALALEKALLHFQVCASVDTLTELETVLRRDKFERYATLAQREAFLDGCRAHTALMEVRLAISDCPDPKDNMFLALAWTADAELIVASDPHLADLHPWREIPILPPAAFLVGIR